MFLNHKVISVRLLQLITMFDDQRQDAAAGDKPVRIH
jgi:hypothetical protein